jgi:hypothetical protein
MTGLGDPLDAVRASKIELFERGIMDLTLRSSGRMAPEGRRVVNVAVKGLEEVVSVPAKNPFMKTAAAVLLSWYYPVKSPPTNKYVVVPSCVTCIDARVPADAIVYCGIVVVAVVNAILFKVMLEDEV